jgi:hypothetical protein
VLVWLVWFGLFWFEEFEMGESRKEEGKGIGKGECFGLCYHTLLCINMPGRLL